MHVLSLSLFLEYLWAFGTPLVIRTLQPKRRTLAKLNIGHLINDPAANNSQRSAKQLVGPMFCMCILQATGKQARLA